MSARGPRKKRGSDAPSDLRAEREEFVRAFLHKGVELTESLISENESLAERARKLEEDNARLRAQLKSDDAIRELLTKIETLERERRALLERSSELAAEAEQTEERHHEAESLLNDLASLYFAAFQLGGTLSLSGVLRHVAELLEQLVGARAFTIYVIDGEGREARAVAARGGSRAEVVSLEEGPLSDVWLTGVAKIHDAPFEVAAGAEALALVPLKVEDEVVGMIEVAQLLPHKRGFARVDHELFKLLSRHAAVALIAANLYENESSARQALRGVHEPFAAESKDTSRGEP